MRDSIIDVMNDTSDSHVYVSLISKINNIIEKYAL